MNKDVGLSIVLSAALCANGWSSFWFTACYGLIEGYTQNFLCCICSHAQVRICGNNITYYVNVMLMLQHNH